MFKTNRYTNYILGISIIGMGIFAWLYDVIPNGMILAPLFIIYGIWRLYRGYVAEH
ncbi:MAG: hypothetical protein J5I52_05675 [Saprospiraceae bacterium]|nr:MAG: hypothetical protein UZ09_BCD002000079 [Bacteroidetes bacterium OLB9]MCO6463620.1 hypothetical protein [Saprospiraceae bacterium]